jgi:hypothetical protein
MPVQRTLISKETPVYNPFIWAIVLLPLLVILLLLTWQPDFHYVTTRQGAPTLDPGSFFSPGFILTQISSVVVWGLSVLFAYMDQQRLERSGVIRPFHWAWALLSGTVYVIGRSVIVRKVAPGRGLAPIWVLIGTVVVSFIVTGIWFSNFMAQLYSQIGYSINA